MMKSRHTLAAFSAFAMIALAAGVFSLVRCGAGSYIADEGQVFGTFYHIKYEYPRSLQPEIEKRLAAVDASLSPFNAKSIITAVNNNRDVRVDSMFRTVFGIAREVSAETGGAFDITVAPLVNLWGFGFSHKDSVSDERVAQLLRTVGYRGVELSPGGRVMKRNPATQLDCSAIAKGYACDVVASLFGSLGIDNYLIEIGGEIVASGVNEKKAPWSVGINRPDDDSTSASVSAAGMAAVLRLTDCAVATSGNYRRFYYRNGRRYAHTIDPRTGYPVQHTLLSSTVIAPDCATADAYATAFMVLGIDSAKQVLKRHPELNAYFIYSDHKGEYAAWATPGVAKFMDSDKNPRK